MSRVAWSILVVLAFMPETQPPPPAPPAVNTSIARVVIAPPTVTCRYCGNVYASELIVHEEEDDPQDDSL